MAKRSPKRNGRKDGRLKAASGAGGTSGARGPAGPSSSGGTRGRAASGSSPEATRGGQAWAAPARHGQGGALVIGALTMTSRVLGLVRDIVLATYFFGKGLDAFALAFTVPNLFRRLFGEGALSGALVPELVKKIDAGDRKGAGRLASRTLSLLGLALGAVAAAVVIVGAVVALILGTETKAGLVAGLLAVVMPYVVPICGAAVVMAFLNATGHFATSAAAPIVLNVVLIGAVLMTKERPTVWALAVAVLVGGAIQFVMQMVAARSRGMPARLELRPRDPDVRRVALTLVPAVAGLAVFQVNVLLDRLIAEVMIPGDGAVGALFLGNRLMQLPLAVFAIAIGTAALPELSSHAGKGDEKAFRKALRGATSSILFWTVPAAVGLALLAEPIVALLFDRGAFTGLAGALPRTSLAVIFYAPGLAAFGVAGLYARALYARGDPKPVVRAAVYSVVVNLVLNLSLVVLFQRIELSPAVGEGAMSGEAGLALASSASAFAYLAVLGSFLGAPAGEKAKATRKGLLAGAAALAAGAAAALATAGVLDTEVASAGWDWLWRVPKLPAVVCVGGFAALAVALGATDRELRLPLLRTSATALGMGVFTNLVLSSLRPQGPSWSFAAQRALAPVVLGGAAYWFLAGFTAAPEYERARAALSRAPGRKGRTDEGDDGSEGDRSRY